MQAKEISCKINPHYEFVDLMKPTVRQFAFSIRFGEIVILFHVEDVNFFYFNNFKNYFRKFSFRSFPIKTKFNMTLRFYFPTSIYLITTVQYNIDSTYLFSRKFSSFHIRV